MRIIPKLTWSRRRRLRRWYHRENRAIVKVRILVVTRLAEAASSVDIEQGLKVDLQGRRSTPDGVANVRVFVL